MSVRDKLLLDLKEIRDPWMLHQIHEFVQLLVTAQNRSKLPNRQRVLQFAGTLATEDAEQMKKEIDDEFSQIEGEW